MAMVEKHLIHGVFIAENKNRFICRVAVDSEEIECYMPSSCRLEKLIDIRGCEVILRPNKSKSARTRYALYAVRKGRQFILINQNEPNRIVEACLHNRRFSFLGKRACIQREKTIDGYKCDLFLPETNTVIEIKSILSFGGKAEFPNVLPQRGTRQLKQLHSLMEKGVKVCYLLVSLNPQIREIRIGEEYAEFHSAFQKCINAGMLCKGLSIKIVNETPEIQSTVPVIF